MIRYGLLSSHYRSPLSWTAELLQQSHQSLDRIYTALRDYQCLFDSVDVDFEGASACNSVDTDVMSALLDDINTPIAISVLHGLVKELNKSDGDTAIEIARRLIASCKMMGLLKYTPSQWFELGKSECALSEAQIDEQVAARQAAKKNKDFALADSIRQSLDAAGIIIEDTREGARWSYKG